MSWSWFVLLSDFWQDQKVPRWNLWMNRTCPITKEVPIDDIRKIKDGCLPMSFTEWKYTCYGLGVVAVSHFFYVHWQYAWWFFFSWNLTKSAHMIGQLGSCNSSFGINVWHYITHLHKWNLYWKLGCHGEPVHRKKNSFLKPPFSRFFKI